MRIATINNLHLNWREDGDPNGVPIVFANSLGTDLRLWDEVVSRLPKGMRAIRYDKRGHGLSSCATVSFTVESLCDDLIQLLTQLKITNCIFVGVSIGGMIGQLLAARRPDLVRALVLSNTAAKMGETKMWQSRITALRESGLENMADQIIERWFGHEFLKEPELVGWRNMLIATPLAGYIGCCEAISTADLTLHAAKVDVPVLVFAGTADQASPVDMVKEFTGLIPQAKLVVLEGVGHLPSAEAPVEFSGHLNQFIREVEND